MCDLTWNKMKCVKKVLSGDLFLGGMVWCDK